MGVGGWPARPSGLGRVGLARSPPAQTTTLRPVQRTAACPALPPRWACGPRSRLRDGAPDPSPVHRHGPARKPNAGTPGGTDVQLLAIPDAALVFAAFSLLGLFAALVPTFLIGVLHDTSHAAAGLVVFLAFAVGACTQLAGSRLPTRPVMLAGLAVFLAALGLIVAGLSAASMPLFLAGTVVSGVAVDAVFMGSLAIANRLTPAETRGQVLSTYFVFAYVGLTVPVIAVGFSSQRSATSAPPS